MLIDDLYRTMPEPENSILCGSSLGAIAALHTAYQERESFGKVISLSGTYWWADESIHKVYENLTYFPTKFIIDYSTGESDALKNGANKFADILRKAGWVDGKDLHIFCHTPEHSVEGDGHNEVSWGMRFGQHLPLAMAA